MPNAEAADADAVAAPPGAGRRATAGAPAVAASAGDEGHPARWWILAVLAAVAYHGAA